MDEDQSVATHHGATYSDTTMHDAAGLCEPGYHRAMPDGSRCRCGRIANAEARTTRSIVVTVSATQAEAYDLAERIEKVLPSSSRPWAKFHARHSAPCCIQRPAG